MIVLRLSPRGKKRHVTYKIVAIEKHRAVKGKFIEDVGSYNPHTKELHLKQDRVKHWLSKGANPSDTVKSLIDKAKGQEVLLIEKRNFKKKTKKEKAKEEASNKEKSEKKEEKEVKEEPKKEESLKEKEEEKESKEKPAEKSQEETKKEDK